MLSALADLVLPRTCAGCGVPGRILCPRCAALLAVPRLAAPRRFPWGFPPTAAAGAYSGPVRPAVNAFKEQRRAELARPLGTALALAVAAVVSAAPPPRGPVLLVPVPSSAAALRARGRDHVVELTCRAVTELRTAGLAACEARLLRRRGRVRDSAGLSAAARRANLAGSFEPAAPGSLRLLPGGFLVLVDDVVTSGATLTEAAAALSALRRPDDPPVLAAVVAATPRRRPDAASGRDLGLVRGRPEIVHDDPSGRLSGPRSRD
jgi:predicted amidophosphoribosyltransferase